jgi:hypothetical protein
MSQLFPPDDVLIFGREGFSSALQTDDNRSAKYSPDIIKINVDPSVTKHNVNVFSERPVRACVCVCVQRRREIETTTESVIK